MKDLDKFRKWLGRGNPKKRTEGIIGLIEIVSIGLLKKKFKVVFICVLSVRKICYNLLFTKEKIVKVCGY